MGDQFTAVDLSLLPLPDAVEVLDYEALLAEWIDDFHTRMLAVDPDFVPLTEADPAYKALETGAYRELLMRQRVNEAILALCLAYARGNDLVHIGSKYNVPKLMLDPGDPDAVPPVEPTYESDDDYRRRIQLAFEGFSTAGPEAAYKFHALSADGDILDVSVQRPVPGEILLTILSRLGDGTASPEQIAAVEDKFADETLRPTNDTVSAQSSTNVDYTVVAELEVLDGPDPEVVLASAQAKLDEYTAAARKLGMDVVLSAIYGALHRPGVHKVNLTSPAADIPISKSEASRCTGTTLTTVAADE